MTNIPTLIRDGRELLGNKPTYADYHEGLTPPDAAFYCWSRNNLPALLDALEAAQKENDRLRADLTQALLSKGLDDVREGRLEAFDPSQEAELVALRRVADAAREVLDPKLLAWTEPRQRLYDALAALPASTEETP